MIFPAAIRRIPFLRILSVEQNMRYDAGHRDDHKEDGTQYRQSQPDVSQRQRNTAARMHLIGEYGLQPIVNRTETETTEGTDKVYDPNVGLLEIADNTAAQTRGETDPQRAPVQIGDGAQLEFDIDFGEFFDLSIANVDDNADCEN